MTKHELVPVAEAAAVEAFDHFLRRSKNNDEQAARQAVAAGWTFAKVWSETLPPKPKKPKKDGEK